MILEKSALFKECELCEENWKIIFTFIKKAQVCNYVLLLQPIFVGAWSMSVVNVGNALADLG